MPIDKNKKRIVFLKYEEIRNLVILAQMHLDAGGAPKVLQQYPLNEEYVQSLKTSIDAMEKILEEIREAEDGTGK
jgi:DUF917 family protein